MALCLTMLANIGVAANLTDKNVENYIASLKALDTLDADEEEFDGWFDAINEEDDAPITMTEVIKRSKDAPVFTEVEKIVKQNGFNNIEQWASTADQVNAAYMRLLMGDPEAVDQELAEVQAELDEMPGLSAEQKQAILAMANEAAEVVNTMTKDVSDTDLEVVKRHLKALDEVLDGE